MFLRFIPDDITFDDEPKDVASEVDLTAYKPKYFTSAAMGTSTVFLHFRKYIAGLCCCFKKRLCYLLIASLEMESIQSFNA